MRKREIELFKRLAEKRINAGMPGSRISVRNIEALGVDRYNKMLRGACKTGGTTAVNK